MNAELEGITVLVVFQVDMQKDMRADMWVAMEVRMGTTTVHTMLLIIVLPTTATPLHLVAAGLGLVKDSILPPNSARTNNISMIKQHSYGAAAVRLPMVGIQVLLPFF